MYFQLFFRETSNKIDLSSAQVNFSILQKSETITRWLNLEVAHISARSCWSEACPVHVAWEMELLFWKWVQWMLGCLAMSPAAGTIGN